MIVGSIDLQQGQTVQLVGGEALAIEAGDPVPLARRFGVVGEVAVIDLDAAKGIGDNTSLVESVLSEARCRVGGGIRSASAARAWLDRGAEKVILGTAARPDVLRQIPKERVIAAVDARDGEVVVEGWRTRTGAALLERVRALAPYVGGFLVTFVEREGRKVGTALERIPALLEAAGDARLTVAGGVRTAKEVAELDRLGVDAQVGMALYDGSMTLGAAVASTLRSDRPDGLFPTVVCDARGQSLGLVYSSRETLSELIDQRIGVYHSRRRGRWEKGASSGNRQRVVSVDVDCDRDALRVCVEQQGSGFCHTGTATCFQDGFDGGLAGLARRLAARLERAPDGSYTRRLLDDPGLLRAKLVEEAGELAGAEGGDAVAHETADLLYFALVAMVRGGVTLAQVESVLDRRARVVTRRPGNAKEAAC
jgi:phosphoribosyl-ATP pyrophosphohydrolase